MSVSALDIARGYRRRNWCVLPVPSRSKIPPITEWEKLRITEDELPQHFNGRPQNIGVQLGEPSGWLIDVDVDHELALKLADKYLPFTRLRFGRTGKPNSHWLYIVTGATPTKQHRLRSRKMIVELRSTGAQTVFPGSIHETGEAIDWIDPDAEPAEIDPAELAQAVANLADAVRHALGETPKKPIATPKPNHASASHGIPMEKRLERWRKYATKMGDAISGSGGHAATLTASCEAVRFDLDASAHWQAMNWWNANKCQPPWTEKELEHKIADAEKIAGHERRCRLERNDRPNAAKRIATAIEAGTSQSTAEIPAHQARGLADFPLTDAGNGEQIIYRHGHALKNIALWKKWMVFPDAGTNWRIDETGASDRLGLETTRALKRMGARMAESDDESQHALGIKILKHAHASESHKKLQYALARAATIAGASIMPDMLDADPWLLNVRNGTLNLKTGELRPHRREDFITKLAPVVYDQAAECAAFLAFMQRIFSANEQLIGFVQRAIGYTLTGITSERAFFILFGAGRNGKSTLLGNIRDMLGDYGTQTAADTLMAKREGIPNDIARLKGARFVSATESDEGRHLAEGLVKRMTGGEDVLTARFMRAEFFDFKPEFKLWLGTNHRPVIRGTDPAIWDRIMLVPFDVRIPDEEVDHGLPAKLRAELPGILAWAVRGCLEWQRNGLQPPQEVRLAVDGYRDDMDRMGDFIAECCVTGERCQTRARALYDLYKVWCGVNGEEAINQTRFGRQLTDRGFGSAREPSGDCKVRLGIGIRASE
jgi:putative DNA primase/helicase